MVSFSSFKTFCLRDTPSPHLHCTHLSLPPYSTDLTELIHPVDEDKQTEFFDEIQRQLDGVNSFYRGTCRDMYMYMYMYIYMYIMTYCHEIRDK